MQKIDFTRTPSIYPSFEIIANNTGLGKRDVDLDALELRPLDGGWFNAAFENPKRHVEEFTEQALLNVNIIPVLESLARRGGVGAVPSMLRGTRKKLLIPGTHLRNTKYGHYFFLCFVHGHTWTPMWRDEDPEDVYVLTLPN